MICHDIKMLKVIENYSMKNTKKTRKLIYEGETHLDNLAEGFSEASRVIDRMPTADVAPRAEVAREIFAEIYEDCFDEFGYIDYEALAELKKKYEKAEKALAERSGNERLY